MPATWASPSTTWSSPSVSWTGEGASHNARLAGGSALDFSAGRRRFEGMRYDLLDEDLVKVGELHPAAGAKLQIVRNQMVKRTLRNLKLFSPEFQRLNPRMRLRPVWVFSTGEEFSCGTFMMIDELLSDGGSFLEAGVMTDLMGVYHEQLDRPFAVAPGDQLARKIRALVEMVATPLADIDVRTDASISTGQSWPAGTEIVTVIEDLCKATGTRLWVDASGMAILTNIDYDERADIDLSGLIIEGSRRYANSSQDVPNRWIATSDADLNYALEGVYDLPDEAPASARKRGRTIIRRVVIQGLTNQDAADRAAMMASLEEEVPFRAVSVEVPARPDLEPYMSVSIGDGFVYVIDQADTELEVGGKTKLDLEALWESPVSRNAARDLTFEGGEPLAGVELPPNRPILQADPAFIALWLSWTPAQRRKWRAWAGSVPTR